MFITGNKGDLGIVIIGKGDEPEGILCTRVAVTLCWSVHGFGCANAARAVDGFGGGARRVPCSLACGMCGVCFMAAVDSSSIWGLQQCCHTMYVYSCTNIPGGPRVKQTAAQQMVSGVDTFIYLTYYYISPPHENLHEE